MNGAGNRLLACALSLWALGGLGLSFGFFATYGWEEPLTWWSRGSAGVMSFVVGSSGLLWVLGFLHSRRAGRSDFVRGAVALLLANGALSLVILAGVIAFSGDAGTFLAFHILLVSLSGAMGDLGQVLRTRRSKADFGEEHK